MIKKLFIAIIVIMCLITFSVILASGVIGVMEEESYAVPASAGIESMNPDRDNDITSLIKVNPDDELYSTVSGYYVGAERHRIDTRFPLFLVSGMSLRFLDEEVWLITTDVELYQSFDGLYLNQGFTYNQDMTQADDGEFILAALSNGLYINAQQAVFEGQLGDIVIPANSILFLTEEYFGWMEMDNGTLKYYYEESVYNAYFVIGEHRYSYAELLAALGLVQDALKQGENGRPDESILQEAEALLQEEPEEHDVQEAEVSIGDTETDATDRETAPSDAERELEDGDEGQKPENEADKPEADGESDRKPDAGPADTDDKPDAGENNSGDQSGNKPGAGESPEQPGGDIPDEGRPGGSEGEGGQPGGSAGGEAGSESGGNAGGAGGDQSGGDITGDQKPGQGDEGTQLPDLEHPEDPNPDENPGDHEGGEVRPGEDAEGDNESGDEEGDSKPEGGEGDGDLGEEEGGEKPDDSDDGEQGDDPPAGEGGGEDSGEEDPGQSGDGESGDEGTPETKPGEPGEDKPDGGKDPGTEFPPDPEDNEGGEEIPGGGDGGESVDSPYRDPQVTLQELETWSYALSMDMKINDPSGAILRGVSFVVYKKLDANGLGGETGTTEDGKYKTYSADDFEGKSAMLRRSRTGSQSFALSPVEPGQTVYLQYNYRYTAENTITVTDPETGAQTEETVTTRKRYFSDYIELKIPTVAEGGVWPVNAGWTEEFAAQPEAMKLSGLTMANSSAYDEQKAAEEYDFENFCLNTLPYVNRLEFRLQEVKNGQSTGSEQVIKVSSSVLSRAQQEGASVSYTSSNPTLKSNTHYTYTVAALDRWGNEIPLVANGETAYSGHIYTRKQAPSAVITELDNVMNELTLSIELIDPDRTLEPGQLVYLTARNNRNGSLAALDGVWDESKISAGGDDVYELALTVPASGADGAKYKLMLNSLAFSMLYSVEVSADYAPQPDGEGMPGSLAVIRDASLAKLTVYTASLEDGLVAFNTSITELKDTSATLNFTMNSASTWDMLPMVDEFRITVQNENGVVVEEVLEKDELSVPDAFPYDEQSATLEIKPGNHEAPQLLLYGDRSQIRGNAWDSFCITVTSTDEEGKQNYSKPMELQMKLPEGSLHNFTDYEFYIEAVVIKSGQEYLIPVSMTNSEFTTKKILPRLYYSDLFVASDTAEFLNLRIVDPDGTILSTANNGNVMVQLYYGSTLLSVQPLKPIKSDDQVGVSLRFDGIIAGGDYSLRFVAAAYNDAAGYGSYESNYQLWDPIPFVGGSDLYGTLELKTLNGLRGDNLMEGAYYVPGTYIYGSGNTSDFASGLNKHTSYDSYIIPVEGNTEYSIRRNRSNGLLRVASLVCTEEELEQLLAGTLQFGTSTKKFKDYVQVHAFDKDLDSYVYTTTADAKYIVLSMNGDGHADNRYNKEVNEKLVWVRRTADMGAITDYTAEIAVTVSDEKGYLGREGEKSEVTITVERSKSMEVPEYKHYESKTLPLEKGEGLQLYLDTIYTLAELHPEDAWRVTLKASYQGSEVQLDQISFRTEEDTVLVSTHAELVAAVNSNPAGHILVTADFEQENLSMGVALQGTVDFQGHIVTRSAEVTYTRYLFDQINEGAVVKNLVYDFAPAARTHLQYGLVNTHYGTIENLLVRTNGVLYADGSIYHERLICYSGGYSSVIRNFIIRLGGDLELGGGSNTIAIYAIGNTNGLVENGYIYGANSSGVVFRDHGANMELFYTYHAEFRNVFFLTDSWYESSVNAALYCNEQPTNSRQGNLYAVGDYYSIASGAKKNWLSPLTECRLLRKNPYVNSYPNVWSVSSRSYNEHEKVLQADTSILYDTEWQYSVLGDGFEIKNSVSMGFYPRLYLPTEMQKYQEYLPLPTQSAANAPEIVSDGWGTGAVYGEHDLDSGFIYLRMKNNNRYPIESVTIEGLICGSIAYQGALDNGQYEVILSVGVDPAAPKYASEYTVTSISYTVGSVTRPLFTDYVTSGFEFWKEVSTAAEWSAINQHMSWNYKLTADIDFAESNNKLTVPQLTINGTQSNNSSNGSFRGKIDGQNHVLKNIKIENNDYPYLIAYLYNGAELKNLLVENMTLSGRPNAQGQYAGLVGQSYMSTIENVRIRNSSMNAGGRMGMLAGYAVYTDIRNCSATNCDITDLDSGRALYAGGLVGYGNSYTHMDRCYTQNVDITVDDTLVVSGVGGLSGIQPNSVLHDCYAHGSIDVDGSNVGGLSGGGASVSTTQFIRCWSYVDIFQRSGNYAGGLIGAGNVPRFYACAALGNVAGTGDMCERISPSVYASLNATIERTFAYSGQIVTGLAEDEPGVHKSTLLDGAQLGQAETWQDEIRLGAFWDYSGVDKGFAPKLAAQYDCPREGWQQTDIPLPGQTGDPSMTLTGAVYDDANNHHQFDLIARLEHPEIEAAEMVALYEEAQRTGKKALFNIQLEGMKLDAEEFDTGRASITVSAVEGQQACRITVSCQTYTKALDTYPLVVSYQDPKSGQQRELRLMVEFLQADGTPYHAYWEIKDISEWNTKMATYGYSGENFRITGKIDFAGGDTTLRELNVNRLEGRGAEAGFANLHYVSDSQGLPWIEKIGTNVSGLSFENLSFYFGGVSKENKRAMTAAVISACHASDLSFKDVKIDVNQYSRFDCGFFSNVSGIFDGVTMENVTLNDLNYSITANLGSYAGFLFARSEGNLLNVKAKNLTVTVYGSYVAGIAGKPCGNAGECRNVEVAGARVSGYQYVAGLFGTSDCYDISGMTLKGYASEESSVTGIIHAGGIFGYVASYGNYHSDMLVENAAITATGNYNRNDDYWNGCAGGISGYANGTRPKDVVIRNCSITGKRWVGGAYGYTGSSRDCINVEVIDCEIINNCELTVLGKSAVGGIIGYVNANSNYYVRGASVQNSTITGPSYAGGVTGWIDNTSQCANHEMIYVGPGVNVTSTANGAGGIVGGVGYVKIINSACAATVSAKYNMAGGLVGQLKPYDNDLRATFTSCYYKGSVSAGQDYAGGLIGMWDSAARKFSDTNMSYVLSAADVRCSGDNVSLWINDSSKDGNAGTGIIYIFRDSLLNGQTAGAIESASSGLGLVSQVLPRRSDGKSPLVTAETLATAKFYTEEMNFNDTKYWSLTHFEDKDNQYMPYTKNMIVTGSPYKETEAEHRKVLDSVAANGILLPEATNIGTETVIYASGVHSINVETVLAEGQDKATVTVNGNRYETNGDGIVTLYYDFETPLKLGESAVEWTESLARRVMTYGTGTMSYWAYLDSDGLVHYGRAHGANSSEMSEVGTLQAEDGQKFVHLWQGYALSSGGVIYRLRALESAEAAGSFGSLEAEVQDSISVTEGNNLKPMMIGEAQVFKPYWEDKGVQVFHNFSLYNGLRIPYRVFGGGSYTTSSAQGVVYDGVVYATMELSGEKRNFFATLGENGSLQCYLNTMWLNPMPNENIDHISNSFGYDNTILLACYEDGSVIGVDYTSGQLVCPVPETESVGLMEYAVTFMSNLFDGVSSGGPLTAEGSFLAGLGSAEPGTQTEDAADTGADGFGDGSGGEESTGANGPGGAEGEGDRNGDSGLDDGSALGYEGAGGMGYAGSGVSGGMDSGVAVEGAPGQTAEGTAGVTADGMMPTTETPTINAGETAMSQGAGIPEEVSAPGEDLSDGAAAQQGEAAPEESADEDGRENSAGYVQPQGGQSGGVNSLTGGAGGTATGGSANGNGSGSSTGGGSGSGGGSGHSNGTSEAEAQALRELFGESALVYSPESGGYERVESAQILSDGRENIGTLSAGAQTDDAIETTEEAADEDKGESDFSIAQGFGRRIGSGEKRGFALLTAAAVVAAAVLIVLYFTVVRKRKATKKRGKH